MEQSFESVRQLVNDFAAQEAAYLSPQYQESQVRQDFIDKFFTALGWDVTHTRQKNPYEQEVKIENRVRTDGSQRFADYAFFNAPNFRDVKFFVEAKKPAHDLLNPGYYHQTVRYGWNQKSSIAVLTDFEEFHILDCRYKPDIKTALNRKLEVFRYTDYVDEETFKKIFFLFGRDAVANGSLDKYAEALPKPKGKAAKKGILKGGYQQVDEAFLELLDGYRNTLAHAFKNRNPRLDGEALTEAVQRTIDRLVFVRFLEDKGIEDKAIGHLGVARNVKSEEGIVWNKFRSLCRGMEPKYNGLVFKDHPVIDSDSFVPPDNDVFAEICNEIADPSSPYDFNSIPISILGSIYERFLGKVVTTTEKRAKVIEKPEVRKAGGVYYTPEHIVRYIVNETLGKLLYDEGGFRLTPQEVAKLKIADIACGSGSFLIEVYSQLLEYHSKYYSAHPEKAKKGDIETREGKVVLSHKKRQEVLVNNIFGVDIDFQATEVTQLSLYLKLMEDVTMNDAYQFSLLKERMLPDLRRNIVCGNSLIGRDILDGKLFDDDTESTLKPMDYKDAFPEIMRNGGFDVVVGNPPYIRIQALKEFNPALVNLIKERYRSAGKGNYDIYVVFVERALSLLNAAGVIGYIVPHKFFNSHYGTPLRELISSTHSLAGLVHFGGQQVFQGATTYTCLLFLGRRAEEHPWIERVDNISDWTTKGISIRGALDADLITAKEWNFTIGRGGKLFQRLDAFPIKLGDLANIFVGLQTSADTVFLFKDTRLPSGPKHVVYSKELDEQVEIESAMLKRVVRSGEIGRYWADASACVLFPYSITDGTVSLLPAAHLEKEYPSTWKYLLSNRKLLADREHGKFKNVGWYQLYPKNLEHWEQPKIMVPYMVTRLAAFLDRANLYFVNVTTGGFGITIDLKYGDLRYFTGLLNSRLLDWFFRNVTSDFHGGYYAANKQYLVQLPIPTLDFNNISDKVRHDRIVSLVDLMMTATARRTAAKTEAERTRLDLQMGGIDRQIDDCVYQLYELTEDEISVVEGK
jgi:hypothetical protein